MRRANARGPLTPSEMAAMAGAITEAATALNAWVDATTAKLFVHGSSRHVAVTRTAAMANVIRLAWSRSIKAPAGVWVISPMTADTVMTAPMLAGCQSCADSR